MKKYARIQNAVAVEIIEISDNVKIDSVFHADVVLTLRPAPDAAQVGWVVSGNTLVAPPPPAPPSIEVLKAYASTKRYAVETAGVVFGGQVLPTTRDGRAALKQARDMLRDGELVDANGTPQTTMKVTIGGASMVVDVAQATAMLKAIAQHVQAAFDAEAIVLAAINAGTIKTHEDIDAAAWPPVPPT